MFTLLLRKDRAEAAQLAEELERHREQLSARLQELEHRTGEFLGTPAGLAASFAAGCGVALVLRRSSREQLIGLGKKALPLLTLARQFL